MYEVILEGQNYNRIRFEFQFLEHATEFVNEALRHAEDVVAKVSKVKEENASEKDGEPYEF